MRPLTILLEEEKKFFETVKDFSQEKIAPHAIAMDKNNAIRKDLLKDFFSMGLMGIEIPDEFGGGGASFFMGILAIEAISQVDPASAVVVDVQNTLVNNAILRNGSKYIQEKYLPQLAKDKIGAYALSEHSSGSDAFALKTTAQKRKTTMF